MLETDVSLDVVEKSTFGVLDLFPISDLSPQSFTPSPCLSTLGTDHIPCPEEPKPNLMPSCSMPSGPGP